jgi:gliding motility-associated-like protein
MGNELVQLVGNSGIYTVIVTDTSTWARCSLTKSIDVKLYGDPISPFVDFADTTLCEGDSLYFNADHFTHDIGTMYRWTSLWDDAVLSDSATLSLGFDQLAPQTYDTLALEILITNPGGCTTADTLLFKFDRPPSLTLTASDSAICLGDSITLFAEGGDSILWSTGETGNQITIAPEQAGDTTIIVTSQNPNTCASVSDTITLYFGDIPDLEIGEDTVLCETDSITYDAFDFRQPFYTQYAWLLDGDTANVLSTEPQLTVVDSMAPRGYEPFRIVAVVTDSLTGCWNSDTVTVQFQRPPSIEIQPYDSMICAGETIVLNAEGTDSVRWYFQDTMAMGKQLLDSPTVEGYYQYIAEGWFPNACSSVFDTAWVYVNPLPEIRAHVVDTVNICADDSVTLLPSGGVSYTWAHDPNATDTLRFVPLQDTSTYVVTGIDANGCSNTDTVVVITTPTIDLGDDIQLCVGDTAFIGQRSPVPATYFWLPTGDTSATISVTQPGTYEVAVTVDSCTYTRSVDVDFKAIPQLVLLQDTTLCFEYGEEMDYATGFPHTIGYELANRDSLATYLEVWTDSDSTFLGNGDSIQITAPGTYRIRVMAQYDKVACEATDTTRVEELCAPRIFIPDAFSPNDDGLNDRFQVFGRHVVDFQMQVYDRWGNLIYALEKERIEDILEDEWWDGSINGTPTQDGNYQYIIRYRSTMDRSPATEVKRGSFLILR